MSVRTYRTQEMEGSGSSSSSKYTHLIIGTSLPLAILSAALSSVSGYNVLHIDRNDFYGSHNASLNLSQLQNFLKARSSRLAFPYFEHDGDASLLSAGLPDALSAVDRHYSISLSPSLQPSAGISLDILIRSGVAKYATFRLLQRTAVWDEGDSSEAISEGRLRAVPSSKEDIFKISNSDLFLLDKRKVMKFLQFCVSGDVSEEELRDRSIGSLLETRFGITGRLANVVMYGIALSPDGMSEPALSAFGRIKTHLQSTGRYGNSAYLVPQYGGAGELAQGYCRVAAVHGATFALGKDIKEFSNAPDSSSWLLKLNDLDEAFEVEQIISEAGNLPPSPERSATGVIRSQQSSSHTLQGLLILDRGIHIPSAVQATKKGETSYELPETPIETGLIVFPPHSLAGGCNSATVTVLVLGEGTFCCPKGQYVVHITTTLSLGGDIVNEEAQRIFTATKEQVLVLTRESNVEWTPRIDSTASHNETEAKSCKPLVEAFWLQDDIETSSKVEILSKEVAATESIIAMPETSSQMLTANAPAPPALTSLLDSATLQAETLFYRLHGLFERVQFPDASKLRKGARRHPSEYRGRAGAGPDLESDEEHEKLEEDALSEVLFFPCQPAADDDEDEDDAYE